MRKMKRILVAICLVMVMALGVPIATPISTQITTVEAATKVKLNKTNVYVSKGDTVQLSLKGTSKKAKWTSTNKKIATVNAKGKVKGIKKGKTTITAKINNKKYKCKVNVEVPSISEKSISINKGSSATLKMRNTKQAVKWSSSNKTVATVSAKGTVQGIKAGNTTITAKVGSKKYTCKVTIKEEVVNVSSISLSESNVTLYVGESKTLNATVYPSNATNKTITWSSSNSGVATVDTNGKVIAKSKGTAYVYAKAGNIVTSGVINVKEKEQEFTNEVFAAYATILLDEKLATTSYTVNSYNMALDKNWNEKAVVIGYTYQGKRSYAYVRLRDGEASSSGIVIYQMIIDWLNDKHLNLNTFSSIDALEYDTEIGDSLSITKVREIYKEKKIVEDYYIIS